MLMRHTKNNDIDGTIIATQLARRWWTAETAEDVGGRNVFSIELTNTSISDWMMFYSYMGDDNKRIA